MGRTLEGLRPFFLTSGIIQSVSTLKISAASCEEWLAVGFKAQAAGGFIGSNNLLPQQRYPDEKTADVGF
jgi:hypothetical protein